MSERSGRGKTAVRRRRQGRREAGRPSTPPRGPRQHRRPLIGWRCSRAVTAPSSGSPACPSRAPGPETLRGARGSERDSGLTPPHARDRHVLARAIHGCGRRTRPPAINARRRGVVAVVDRVASEPSRKGTLPAPSGPGPSECHARSRARGAGTEPARRRTRLVGRPGRRGERRRVGRPPGRAFPDGPEDATRRMSVRALRRAEPTPGPALPSHEGPRSSCERNRIRKGAFRLSSRLVPTCGTNTALATLECRPPMEFFPRRSR